MNDQAVIECRQLVKTYKESGVDVPVLKGVDFRLNKGERLAIMGASGSGKSTLLQLLGGLDTPTSGEVLMSGQNINTMNEKQRCAHRNQYLGYVYQFHHLLAEFSALENVAMPLLIGDASVEQAKQKAFEVLKAVGLESRVEHRFSELSGGERQRVAIARALVHDPQCVLADEPTGNLDKKTAEQIYQLLLELNQTYQTSFLLVTHDTHLAEKMDRVLVLDDGRFLE